MMKRVLIFLGLILVGLFLGGISALWMSGLIGARGSKLKDVNVNDWESDWSVGSAAADGYTRARVARFGLLGLAKSEAVYFIRNVDDEGAVLSGNCSYEVTGGGQEALWWSITLYDQDSRLPMNEDGSLSIDQTKVKSAESWSAVISKTRPENGYWLSSNGADTFDLTLRLYQPSADIIHSPENTLNAPKVRKLSCEAAS